jgi:hypothetical protein
VPQSTHGSIVMPALLTMRRLSAPLSVAASSQMLMAFGISIPWLPAYANHVLAASGSGISAFSRKYFPILRAPESGKSLARIVSATQFDSIARCKCGAMLFSLELIASKRDLCLLGARNWHPCA